MSDGDTVFSLGTGLVANNPGMMTLCTLAAEVTARAVVRAVMAADGVRAGNMHWPSARELAADSSA